MYVEDMKLDIVYSIDLDFEKLDALNDKVNPQRK